MDVLFVCTDNSVMIAGFKEEASTGCFLPFFSCSCIFPSSLLSRYLCRPCLGRAFASPLSVPPFIILCPHGCPYLSSVRLLTLTPLPFGLTPLTLLKLLLRPQTTGKTHQSRWFYTQPRLPRTSAYSKIYCL